jgi:hypothetical protein
MVLANLELILIAPSPSRLLPSSPMSSFSDLLELSFMFDDGKAQFGCLHARLLPKVRPFLRREGSQPPVKLCLPLVHAGQQVIRC